MGAHMSKEDHKQIWDRFEAGESWTAIGNAIGRPLTTVRDVVIRHSGRRPKPPTVWSDRERKKVWEIEPPGYSHKGPRGIGWPTE